MTSLRAWFGDFTDQTGETPHSIVLAFHNGYGRGEGWPTLPVGVTLWASLDPAILDREFDDGYGGNEAPDLCAWSPTWVLFVDNYDGAESLCWLPRNPTGHEPIRPGGG